MSDSYGDFLSTAAGYMEIRPCCTRNVTLWPAAHPDPETETRGSPHDPASCAGGPLSPACALHVASQCLAGRGGAWPRCPGGWRPPALGTVPAVGPLAHCGQVTGWEGSGQRAARSDWGRATGMKPTAPAPPSLAGLAGRGGTKSSSLFQGVTTPPAAASGVSDRPGWPDRAPARIPGTAQQGTARQRSQPGAAQHSPPGRFAHQPPSEQGWTFGSRRATTAWSHPARHGTTRPAEGPTILSPLKH